MNDNNSIQNNYPQGGSDPDVESHESTGQEGGTGSTSSGQGELPRFFLEKEMLSKLN